VLFRSKVGLVTALDTRLPILKRRRPYSEADHVLNLHFAPYWRPARLINILRLRELP